MLQEKDRLKLDGIVKQMVTNQESDQDIQFVVNDFKSRYDTKPEKPDTSVGFAGTKIVGEGIGLLASGKMLAQTSKQGSNLQSQLDERLKSGQMDQARHDQLSQGLQPDIQSVVPKRTTGDVVRGGIKAGTDIASLAIGGGGAGTLAENTVGGLIKQGAIQGATSGALGGGLQGFGQGLEDSKTITGGLISGTKGAVSGAVIGGAVGAALPAVSAGVSKVKQALTPTPEFDKIVNTISPKLNQKELKLALKEGGIAPGQDATLLRGGTPDTIIPSDKTLEVAQTVKQNIPSAGEMKPTKLFQAINSKGLELRDNLIPVMKTTPVTPETIQTIQNDWNTLKAVQRENPYLSTGANLDKLQKNFEDKFLLPTLTKPETQTMNNLWEATQAYDQSVPLNVKNATSLSSDVLQDQKAIWLQNRGILAKATHNVATGMEPTAQQAFSDMSNLYKAKENMLSKVKLMGASPNKITQWVKNNPWKAGLVGLGIGQATGANKFVGGALKAMTGL